MEFDCRNHHCKCKAICCGIIDFPKNLWEKIKNKVVTNPVEVIEFSKELNDELSIILVTETRYCAFLNKDYTCNIYEERPIVCREYRIASTQSCPYLKWLDDRG
ncbi:MAG: YkgJ family cysteine cluster protein [Chlamydiota bacterium]